MNRVEAKQIVRQAIANNFDPKHESSQQLLLSAGFDERQVMRIQTEALRNEQREKIHSGATTVWQ